MHTAATLPHLAAALAEVPSPAHGTPATPDVPATPPESDKSLGFYWNLMQDTMRAQAAFITELQAKLEPRVADRECIAHFGSERHLTELQAWIEGAEAAGAEVAVTLVRMNDEPTGRAVGIRAALYRPQAAAKAA